MLFFSDVRQYVPVKLCKSAGSIHLFQLYGQLDPNQIILEKNCLWDMIKIDWKEVFDFEWHNSKNAKNSQSTT